MRALGHQGARALRQPAPNIRLVTTMQPAKYLAIEKDILPADPALGDPETTRRTETALLRQHLADSQARVVELEADLEHARRQLDAAREDGLREATARVAKTHGGRLPSILTR